MAAVYLATYVASSLAAPPTAALGTGEPATGTWTKLGLLQGDDFTPNTTQATFLEDVRGFKKVRYGRALNQAGSMSIEALIVETDPAAIGLITGASPSAVGAGVKMQLSYDTLLDRSMLVWTKNAFDSAEERYVYIPHAQVTWELTRGENDVLAIRLVGEALQYINGATNYLFKEVRF